jgi:hypothetical protein
VGAVGNEFVVVSSEVVGDVPVGVDVAGSVTFVPGVTPPDGDPLGKVESEPGAELLFALEMAPSGPSVPAGVAAPERSSPHPTLDVATSVSSPHARRLHGKTMT